MHRTNDLANFHRSACVYLQCVHIYTLAMPVGEFNCNKVTKYVDYGQASQSSFDLWYVGRQIGRRGPFSSLSLFLCSTSLWNFLSPL